jgi:hypothetical protein
MRGRAIPFRQQASEMGSNRAHATAAVLCFRVGIVVGVGVDVVGKGLASVVDDELDSGNADVIRGKERLPSRHQRMFEFGQDLKLVAGCDRGARARDGFDLAGVGRAQLKALRCIDPHGIDEFAAHEPNAGRRLWCS